MWRHISSEIRHFRDQAGYRTAVFHPIPHAVIPTLQTSCAERTLGSTVTPPTCRDHVHLFLTRHYPVTLQGYGVVTWNWLIVPPLTNMKRKTEQVEMEVNLREAREVITC
jgi:hypothetical protein